MIAFAWAAWGFLKSPATLIVGGIIAAFIYGQHVASQKCDAAAWKAKYEASQRDLTVATRNAARATELQNELDRAEARADENLARFNSLGVGCPADQSGLDGLYDIIQAKPRR